MKRTVMLIVMRQPNSNVVDDERRREGAVCRRSRSSFRRQ